MILARRRRFLPPLVLTASTLLASSLAPTPLPGADDGGARRDGERAVTLTLKALGGDRSEGPPAYSQLQPIRIEYTLKLGKFAGLDHIFYFEAHELTNFGIVKVSKDGAKVPGTLHSSSDWVKMMDQFSKRRRLEPGESFTGVLIVNLLHDMTAEGTYQVDMNGTYQYGTIEEIIKVEAAPITVRVKRYPL